MKEFEIRYRFDCECCNHHSVETRVVPAVDMQSAIERVAADLFVEMKTTFEIFFAERIED